MGFLSIQIQTVRFQAGRIVVPHEAAASDERGGARALDGMAIRDTRNLP